MAEKKRHVIEQRWQTGAFHVERHVRCRCGKVFTHYNATVLRERFKAHQAAAEMAAK